MANIRSQIGAACADAGRDPSAVTLIAVTKGFPADDIRILCDLGVTDVGESRAAEGLAKRNELSTLPLTWHCVGQVQTNKATQVVRWADLVHSVDRSGLVEALQRAAVSQDRTVDVLMQIDVVPPDFPRSVHSARGGCSLGQVTDLATTIGHSANLRLLGVMSVADPALEPAWVFGRLQAEAERLRQRYPSATVVSAGMSEDFATALAAGATHLRIGSAILGERR